MITEIKAPANIHSVVWYPEYQLPGFGVPVKSNKPYMVTQTTSTVSFDRIVGATPDDTGLVSGLQVSGDPNVLARNKKKWILGRNESKSTDPNTVASSVYGQNDKDTIIFAQFQEDCQCATGFGEVVEAAFRKMFEYYRDNQGGTIDNTHIHGDYFMNNYGWGTDSNMGIGQTMSELAMSSATEAQKIIYHEPNSGNGFTANEQGYYYRFNGFDYRHRMCTGYQDGVAAQANAEGIFNQIFNLERQYIARSDRRVITFAWGQLEGVNSKIEAINNFGALPLQSPDGEIIRRGFCESSFDLFFTQATLSLLIADGEVVWNTRGDYGLDPNCFGLPYGFTPPDSTVRWKPAGGSEVDWNPSDGSQHPRTCSSGQPQFALPAAPRENAGYAAHYIYSQIWQYCDGDLIYPNYSFIRNGVSKTGYYNGNAPVTGTLGNQVSRYGKANIGQNNVVKKFFNGINTICFAGRGQADTSKRVVFLQDFDCAPTNNTVWTINEYGGPYTFTTTGSSMHIFTF